MNEKFDIIIIGSGLGGLVTGNLLAKKGFRVAIIEKNKFSGGCLQSFEKDGVIFDTGIHYVGGLGKGQVLERLFNYLDVLPKLSIREMDPESIDHFIIGTDEYSIPKGYNNIHKRLISYFPAEKEGIQKYLAKIKEIADSITLYNLEHTPLTFQNFYDKFDYGNTWEFICSVTPNKRLQQLLSGLNTLYAGTKASSFLFVHALICNHYYEGAYRFVDGSRQIADSLCENIVKMGGSIFLNNKVTKFKYSGNIIQSAITEEGHEFYADSFISDIHPYYTMELIGPNIIRNSYRNRIKNLPNTISMFSLYIILEDGKVPYMNSNYHYYPDGDMWGIDIYDPEKFPLGFGIYPVADSIDEKYTRGVSVLGFMDYKELEQWENTSLENRGKSYKDFKEYKVRKMIDKLNEHFPELCKYIKSWTASTPLTLRDYNGTYRGSVYGIMKDCRNAQESILFSKTKVPNLFITGQNLSLHGFMGVSIGALLTCAEFTDLDKLLDEINDGQKTS
jgi:all-trans-retinol 13,14-reductase